MTFANDQEFFREYSNEDLRHYVEHVNIPNDLLRRMRAELARREPAKKGLTRKQLDRYLELVRAMTDDLCINGWRAPGEIERELAQLNAVREQ